MYLTGFVHRERLFELTTRWLSGRVAPGDGRFVTQAFIYEPLITGPPIERFLTGVAGSVWTGAVVARRVSTKDEVREAIMRGTPAPDPRAVELFARYRAYPDEFFPHTPVDLILAERADATLLGMARFKGIPRLADKAARRVADRLSGRVRAEARRLAGVRARAAGLPLDRLISSPEAMDEDFFEAERTVSRLFESGDVLFAPDDLRVDDVVGFKFVDRPERLERLERAIAAYPGATVVEREEHRGVYNDVNLLVDVTLPPVEAIVDAQRGRDWSAAARRGIDPVSLASEFAGYVESGARTVRTEVILTTPEELVESEFGRSIHEERVLAQREKNPYSGRIARNAAAIVSYLLELGTSPVVDVAALPVKMWGRYLPDTVARATSDLFGGGRGVARMGAFVADPFGIERGALLSAGAAQKDGPSGRTGTGNLLRQVG